MIKDISFLLLSCDKYKDLWNDFFSLKEKYWHDCQYQWTIVTETEDFCFENVSVLKCGKTLNWTGRLQYAVEHIGSKYVCFFLDDFFISSTIDNNLIERLIKYAFSLESDYFVLGDAFSRSFNSPVYMAEHIIQIPYNREYGIDTSVAIWKSSFLLSLIKDKDCSAWQFELDRLVEARNSIHKGKLLLYDDRKPLNVSDIPVVIQGKYYPKALKDFKKRGYSINVGNRPVMSKLEVFKYDLKVYLSKVKFGKKFLKYIAAKFMGYKFFQ